MTVTVWAEEPGLQVTAECRDGVVVLRLSSGAEATIARYRWERIITATAAVTTADAVIEAARKFRDEVSDIRSGIFYWMTRNHNRGERSYAELGQAKERLTAAIKSYDNMLAAHDRAQGERE